MGVVYRTTNLTLGREAALKVVHPGRGSLASLRQRFEREIALSSRVEHPSVARVYHAGTFSGGTWGERAFLEMEFVRGRPLDVAADRDRWDRRRRVHAVAGVCDAVAAAHRMLVVHRDLKPSNVLVTDDGSDKVVDFGLAKAIEDVDTAADTSPGSAVTREGMLVGTVYFMAPEQALGSHPPGTPTDVYSLGVVLYYLLLGRLPHDPVSAPVSDGTNAAGERPRPPIRARSGEYFAALCDPLRRSVRPRERDPSFPLDLEAILMRALEHEPSRRYGSADALAADLRRWLDGLPVTARAQTPAYLLSRHVARHRRRYAVAALAVAALSGLAAWAVTSVVRERDAARAALALAEQRRNWALEQARANESASGFLYRVLSNGLRGHSDGRPWTVQDHLDFAEGALYHEVTGNPYALATAEHALSTAYMHVDVARSLVLATRALDRATRTVGPDHPLTLKIRVTRANVLANMGEPRAAEIDFRRSISDVERLYPGDALENVAFGTAIEARRCLASIASQQGRHQESRDLLTWLLAQNTGHEVIAVRRDSFLDSIPVLDALLGKPGAVRVARDRFAQRLASTGGQRDALVSFELNLGIVLVSAGEYDEGEALLRRNLDLRRVRYGDRSNLLSLPLLALAESAGKQGQWDLAATRYAEARASLSASQGEGFGGYARATRLLHDALLRAGRESDAAAEQARVLAAARRMADGTLPVSPEMLAESRELFATAGTADDRRALAEATAAAARRADWSADDPRHVVLASLAGAN